MKKSGKAAILSFGIFAIFSRIAAPVDMGQRVFLVVVGLGYVVMALLLLRKK